MPKLFLFIAVFLVAFWLVGLLLHLPLIQPLLVLAAIMVVLAMIWLIVPMIRRSS